MKITSTLELTRHEVTALRALEKRIKETVPEISHAVNGDFKLKVKSSFSNLLYKIHAKDTVHIEVIIDYSEAYVIDTMALMDSFCKEILAPALQLAGRTNEFFEKLKEVESNYPMDDIETELSDELEEVDLDGLDVNLDTVYSELKAELKNS